MNSFKDTLIDESSLTPFKYNVVNDSDLDDQQIPDKLNKALQNFIYYQNHSPSIPEFSILLSSIIQYTNNIKFLPKICESLSVFYPSFVSIFKNDLPPSVFNDFLHALVDISYYSSDFCQIFINNGGINKLQQFLTQKQITKYDKYFKNFYILIGNLAADFASFFPASFFYSLSHQLISTNKDNQLACSSSLFNFFRHSNEVGSEITKLLFLAYTRIWQNSNKFIDKNILYNLTWCAYFHFSNTPTFGDFLTESPFLPIIITNISPSDPNFSSVAFSLLSYLLLRNDPNDNKKILENLNIGSVLNFVKIGGDCKTSALNLITNYLLNGVPFVSNFCEFHGNLMIAEIYEDSSWQDKIYLSISYGACVLGSTPLNIEAFCIQSLLELIPEMLDIDDKSVRKIILLACIKLKNQLIQLPSSIQDDILNFFDDNSFEIVSLSHHLYDLFSQS